MKAVISPNHLSRIVLEGYKSIAQCDLEMGSLNIFIGANGAGKSNFIGFFRLIAVLLDHRLQVQVGKAGGPDALLHFGRKTTDVMNVELYFGNNGYKFILEPTNDNRMMFQREALWWNVTGDKGVASGHFESKADQHTSQIKNHTLPVMRSWRVFHFHDTSDSAKVKQIHRLNDNDYFREDGANLAAFLYRLQSFHADHYQRIVRTIQLVAPFFGNFYLRTTPDNPDFIQLEWTEQGQDIPFKASEFSDGTLRFILMATVLLQPDELMPSTIIIDEPELGLHPYAITVLASLVKLAAQKKQLILSTQSVELVDQFDAEDLVVVDKHNGGSSFKRPSEESFKDWLKDYSLGELWKKNLLGGRPQ